MENVRIAKGSPKTVALSCDGCGTSFVRSMKLYKRSLRKGHAKFHCTPQCYKRAVPRPCDKCGLPTSNPKFCSRSCAASVTGSTHPKRAAYRVKRVCTLCTNSFVCSKEHTSTSYCKPCSDTRKHRKVSSELTIGYYINGHAVKGRHPSWVRVQIRELNRRSNSRLLKLPCHSCGYGRHVELAHIRPISSFPKSALVREVNHPDNVIQLCPNCHWEFDHHLLLLDLGRPTQVRSGT